MADIVVTITVPDAYVLRVKTAIDKMKPIEKNPDGTPKYSYVQWFKVVTKEYWVTLVQMAEEAIAMQAARSGVSRDENIVQ